VFHAALVGPEYSDATIPITWADRMSWVQGALSGAEAQARRDTVRRWVEPKTFDVPARTLASLLDEAAAPGIDFLSLDVEGYEPEVLRGLDVRRYRPAWVLVECRTPAMRESVEAALPGYVQVAILSHHDYLFRDAQ
jgi:FkbM family methyltransferase